MTTVTLRTVTALTALAAASVLPTGVRAQNELAATERRLDNGLRVVVGTGPTPALFSEVMLVARAGTSLDAESAPVAGEALLIGAGGVDDGPLVLARLGASASHTVGRDVAVFRFAVPATGTVAVLEWLSRSVARPSIRGAALDRAIAQRAAQVAGAAEDPWIRALERLSQMVWRAGPLPQAAAPVGDAVDVFWRTAYAPANLVLTLHTPLPRAELDDHVQRLFGGIAARTTRELMPAAEPALAAGGRTECMVAPGASMPALLVGLGADAPDDRVFYAWQLIAHILGASHSSRLHERLRLETQSVYTVEVTSTPISARRLTVRVALQTQDLAGAREVVMAELRRIVREPVRAEELNLARALLGSRLKMDRGSMRELLYHRALAQLGAHRIADGREADRLLAGFTPASLRDALQASADPRAASALIVSAKREPWCDDDTSQ